ncbi:MAG: CHAT domain-containing protein, partial [Caldilinea sp.]|nr:CHAT domain-containing protein [Caldilinea sp.]
PTDLEPLDIAAERQNLAGTLQRLVDAKMVEIDWAPHNSLASLIAMLGQRDYHIFHFMGHGALLGDTGSDVAGYLMFENADGTAAPVSAERLGQAFRRTVRLAMINACEGAAGNAQTPSAGVATSLLQQGIPAVVAMQFSISGAIAIPFAGEFYSAMAVGLPVDAAVTSARRNVWARFDGSGEWATPVLFLRAPDGHLFSLDSSRASDAKISALRQAVVKETIDKYEVTPSAPDLKSPLDLDKSGGQVELSSGRKIVFYILSFMSPIIGLTLYFIYRDKTTREDRSAARVFLVLGIVSFAVSCGMLSIPIFLGMGNY